MKGSLEVCMGMWHIRISCFSHHAMFSEEYSWSARYLSSAMWGRGSTLSFSVLDVLETESWVVMDDHYPLALYFGSLEGHWWQGWPSVDLWSDHAKVQRGDDDVVPAESLRMRCALLVWGYWCVDPHWGVISWSCHLHIMSFDGDNVQPWSAGVDEDLWFNCESIGFIGGLGRSQLPHLRK